eukprot:TRINITY_DN3925_c0_g1_i1.p3 TRINITY_DN3925_c0_g1~~TRINITY_DN3925_c0_g1_i1.p3  ORF type:complete len:148 (+),score=50.20 TRINITY_DN3925_c0_g1_i1:61-504(+)
MALRPSSRLLFRATAPALGGANPYFHFPRDVTRTVMRENWQFAGKAGMFSYREQQEYRNRNVSYGNIAIWWQSHLDVILNGLPIVYALGTLVVFLTFFAFKASGNMGPWWMGMHKVWFSLGTRGWAPGPVWFEEEARQKKIGLFAED